MRILGIDPRSHRTGYAVLDLERRQLTYRECGVLVAKSANLALARIHFQDLESVVSEFSHSLSPLKMSFRP